LVAFCKTYLIEHSRGPQGRQVRVGNELQLGKVRLGYQELTECQYNFQQSGKFDLVRKVELSFIK